MASSSGTRIVGKVYGDLTGSVFEPTVVGIQNVNVSVTAPQHNQALIYNSSSNSYVPTSISDQELNSGSDVAFQSVQSTFFGPLIGTASYALTASYVLNGGGGGSSFDQNLNTTNNVQFLSVTSSFSGNLEGSASYSTNSLTASYAQTIPSQYDQNLNTTNSVEFFRLYVGNSLVTGSGEGSLSQGWNTNASGNYSHAQGQDNIAIGVGSHAEGQNTVAIGDFSHTSGDNTIASGSHQTVIGKYNTENNTDSLFIVGNGNYSSRSDIFLVNNDKIIVSGGLETTNYAILNGSSSQYYPSINVSNTFTAVQTFSSSFTASAGHIEGNLVVVGTASIGTINTIVQNELRIGDKYIVIVSGGVGHEDLDNSGILWGSGSQDIGETLDENGSHAHILYKGGAVDRVDIFPGINTTAISASQYSGALPNDIIGEKVGRPKTSETIYKMRAVRSFRLETSGHYFESIVSSSNAYDFALLKDSTQIGTASFGVGSSSANIVFDTDPVFSTGELLSVRGQVTRDNTLSDVFFTFKGNTI